MKRRGRQYEQAMRTVAPNNIAVSSSACDAVQAYSRGPVRAALPRRSRAACPHAVVHLAPGPHRWHDRRIVACCAAVTSVACSSSRGSACLYASTAARERGRAPAPHCSGACIDEEARAGARLRMRANVLLASATAGAPWASLAPSCSSSMPDSCQRR